MNDTIKCGTPAPKAPTTERTVLEVSSATMYVLASEYNALREDHKQQRILISDLDDECSHQSRRIRERDAKIAELHQAKFDETRHLVNTIEHQRVVIEDLGRAVAQTKSDLAYGAELALQRQSRIADLTEEGRKLRASNNTLYIEAEEWKKRYNAQLCQTAPPDGTVAQLQATIAEQAKMIADRDASVEARGRLVQQIDERVGELREKLRKINAITMGAAA